jgi:hypothetical protein
MVIRDLNIKSLAVHESKTNTPLIINATGDVELLAVLICEGSNHIVLYRVT